MRIDDARPKVDRVGVVRHRGRARRSPTSRCSTRRSTLATHQPERCVVLQRPQLEAELSRAATSTGRAASPAPSPAACVPVAATDPLYILYTSGTTGQPKGVVRDNGGHAVALHWSMRERLRRRSRARSSGPPPTSAGSSGTPTSSTRRCCTAATTVLYEGKPVGTPDAGAFWRVIARAWRRSAVHGADRVPGDQARRIPTATLLARPRPLGAAHAVPRRRALRPRHLRLGRAHARRPGHRPLVADRDRLADRRQLPRHRAACRSSPARRRLPVPGYDVRVLDDDGARVPRRRAGRDRDPAAAAARARCRRSGTTTSASSRRTSTRYPGYYLTGDGGLLRRGRLRLRDGPHRRRHQRRRPPALDRRDGGGGRRRIPTWPSAP